MRYRRKVSAGAVVASLALICTWVGPAYASEDVDTVSVADVERALAGVRAGLVEDAAASSRTDDAVAVLDVGGSTVTVPRDAPEGVKLAVGDAVVGISLPAAEGGEAGVSLESGAVAYPSDNGVANTVVPFSDGVQMLTTIASSKSSRALRLRNRRSCRRFGDVGRGRISGGCGSRWHHGAHNECAMGGRCERRCSSDSIRR